MFASLNQANARKARATRSSSIRTAHGRLSATATSPAKRCGSISNSPTSTATAISITWAACSGLGNGTSISARVESRRHRSSGRLGAKYAVCQHACGRCQRRRQSRLDRPLTRHRRLDRRSLAGDNNRESVQSNVERTGVLLYRCVPSAISITTRRPTSPACASGTGVWSVGLSTGDAFGFSDWDSWPTNPARLQSVRSRTAFAGLIKALRQFEIAHQTATLATAANAIHKLPSNAGGSRRSPHSPCSAIDGKCTSKIQRSNTPISPRSLELPA